MDERLKVLDYAFNPRSVAFIGASENVSKWGFLILNNLITGGYEGKIYPVNPSRETILGLPAYTSVLDIPSQIDLAVFTVPARNVLGALDDCAARGVKASLVITAGFKELGVEGAGIEREMVRRARAAGMAIIGPNCQGICCPRNKLYPWMPILFQPPAGKISFVAQSGNILNMLTGHVVDFGLGISKAVSSGNEADLKTEDYFSYYLEDPDTQVIVSYIEGIRDGRSFLEKASAVASKKPVVVLKGGRTRSGISAARSHTGAMAVSEALFEAACRQAGLFLASTIEDTSLTAASFVGRPLPRGRRVGIVTSGGGLGVIAADYCTETGLEVAKLSPETMLALGNLLPDWWVPGNPVDMVAGLDFTILKPTIEILMKSGEVDAVLFLWIDAPRDHQKAEKLAAETGMNIPLVWNAMERHFATFTSELYQLMWELGVPLYIAASPKPEKGGHDCSENGGDDPLIFPSVESACRAVKAMSVHHDHLYGQRAVFDSSLPRPEDAPPEEEEVYQL